MYQQRSNRLATVARAGAAGVCSIYLLFLAFFLFFTACALLGMSSAGGIENNPHFQDDFFQDSRDRSRARNQGFKIAGSIIMVIAIVMAVVAIGLCYYVCKKASQPTTRSGGLVVQQGTPLVIGSNPPPAGYHVQTGGVPATYPTGPQPIPGYPGQPPQGYPSQPQGYQGYPAPQPGYPAPQPGYPAPQPGYPAPQQGYPAPQAGGYPPPAGGYPPPQGAGYPPPAGGYPPPAEGYPPPQQDYKPPSNEPSAPPPPSYSSVTEKSGLP